MLEAGLDGVVERLGAWHWVELSPALRSQGAGLILCSALILHILINRSH
jgi:hypothetical protein